MTDTTKQALEDVKWGLEEIIDLCYITGDMTIVCIADQALTKINAALEVCGLKNTENEPNL